MKGKDKYMSITCKTTHMSLKWFVLRSRCRSRKIIAPILIKRLTDGKTSGDFVSFISANLSDCPTERFFYAGNSAPQPVFELVILLGK